MKSIDEKSGLDNVNGGMTKFLESSSVVKVGVTDLTRTGWEDEAQEVVNICVSRGFSEYQASLLKNRVLDALTSSSGRTHTVSVKFGSGLAKGLQVFQVSIEK